MLIVTSVKICCVGIGICTELSKLCIIYVVLVIWQTYARLKLSLMGWSSAGYMQLTISDDQSDDQNVYHHYH